MGSTTSQIEDGIVPRPVHASDLPVTNYVKPKWILFAETQGNRFAFLRKRIQEMKLSSEHESQWMDRIYIDECMSASNHAVWSWFISRFESSPHFHTYMDYLMVKCLMKLWLSSSSSCISVLDGSRCCQPSWKEFRKMFSILTSSTCTSPWNRIGESFDRVQQVAYRNWLTYRSVGLVRAVPLALNENEHDKQHHEQRNEWRHESTYYQMGEFVHWFCIVNSVSFWVALYRYEPIVWTSWLQSWWSQQTGNNETTAVDNIVGMPGLIPHIATEIYDKIKIDIPVDGSDVGKIDWMLMECGIWNEFRLSTHQMLTHVGCIPTSRSMWMVVAQMQFRHSTLIQYVNQILFRLRSRINESRSLSYACIEDGFKEYPSWKEHLDHYYRECYELPLFVLYEFRTNHPLHQVLLKRYPPSASSWLLLVSPSSPIPTQKPPTSLPPPPPPPLPVSSTTVKANANSSFPAMSTMSHTHSTTLAAVPSSPTLTYPNTANTANTASPPPLFEQTLSPPHPSLSMCLPTPPSIPSSPSEIVLIPPSSSHDVNSQKAVSSTSTIARHPPISLQLITPQATIDSPPSIVFHLDEPHIIKPKPKPKPKPSPNPTTKTKTKTKLNNIKFNHANGLEEGENWTMVLPTPESPSLSSPPNGVMVMNHPLPRKTKLLVKDLVLSSP